MASTELKELMNLEHDKVDVWRVNLDVDNNSLNELQSLLSEKEIARAEKLIPKKKRKRFIVSRGMLRKILSHYTGQNPKELKFQYNKNGKPELIDSSIYFNLSHSEDLALYAVALNRAVGIDIEKIKDDTDHMRLAKEYFSEKEYNNIINLPADKQKETFYRIWTRKEAFAKAKGGKILQLLD
ncbi:4'-phosphopantetheinyl transferase superfamily protein, partial [Candidatus Woesearchaeota archaeon]|nr:4'-phosphopantetheinyl transferase superfamily protein [Candidatus Woesearchaeota archaeon]